MNNINLHIFPDDKFYNGFIGNVYSLKFSSNNEFIVISRGSELRTPPKYNHVQILKGNEYINFFKNFNFSNYNQVIFHSLRVEYRQNIIPLIPANIKITWILYGHELYSLPQIKNQFLQPKTKFWNKISNLKSEKRSNTKLDLKRIDRFAHFDKFEFNLIKKNFQTKNLTHIPFAFCIPKPNIQIKRDAKRSSLIIGNSASIYNNHLDIISDLRKDNLRTFKNIIIPFSYGNPSKKYSKIVRFKYKYYLGSKCIFLDNFLPMDEYYKLFSSARCVVMPQLRSQAGGNINFCFYNKIPVVMYQTSILYNFFKSAGANIITISEFNNGKFDLSEEGLNTNIRVREEIFGTKSKYKYYKTLLDEY